jgi:hypothetical protein
MSRDFALGYSIGEIIDAPANPQRAALLPRSFCSSFPGRGMVASFSSRCDCAAECAKHDESAAAPSGHDWPR